jgi:hypothetical protein
VSVASAVVLAVGGAMYVVMSDHPPTSSACADGLGMTVWPTLLGGATAGKGRNSPLSGKDWRGQLHGSFTPRPILNAVASRLERLVGQVFCQRLDVHLERCRELAQRAWMRTGLARFDVHDGFLRHVGSHREVTLRQYLSPAQFAQSHVGGKSTTPSLQLIAKLSLKPIKAIAVAKL